MLLNLCLVEETSSPEMVVKLCFKISPRIFGDMFPKILHTKRFLSFWNIRFFLLTHRNIITSLIRVAEFTHTFGMMFLVCVPTLRNGPLSPHTANLVHFHEIIILDVSN